MTEVPGPERPRFQSWAPRGGPTLPRRTAVFLSWSSGRSLGRAALPGLGFTQDPESASATPRQAPGGDSRPFLQGGAVLWLPWPGRHPAETPQEISEGRLPWLKARPRDRVGLCLLCGQPCPGGGRGRPARPRELPDRLRAVLLLLSAKHGGSSPRPL